MKKRFFGAVLILAVACMTMCGCGKKESADSGTDDPYETKIEKDGTSLKVTYDSNPTTGYSWTQKVSDETILQSVNDDYEADAGTESGVVVLGRGGKETFEYKGLKAGKVKITFIYARPWKGGGEAERRYVTVKVGDGGTILSAEQTGR